MRDATGAAITAVSAATGTSSVARTALEPLLAAGADPRGYLARPGRAGGRPAVGYVCSYVPEEVILAAGLHPVRLGARPGPAGPADTYLQSFACSFARALLDGLLTGSLMALGAASGGSPGQAGRSPGGPAGGLAGVAFAYTCDSLRAVFEAWRRRAPAGTLAHFLNLPARVEGPGVEAYAASEFKRFGEALCAVDGSRPVTPEGLVAASRVTRAVREGLSRLAAVRSARPDLLPGSLFLAAARGASVLDREEAGRVLAAAAERLEGQTAATAAAASEAAGRATPGAGTAAARATGSTGVPPLRPRLLVSGGFLETEQPLRLIEEAGASVVADDLCLGGRWFACWPEAGAAGDAEAGTRTGAAGAGHAGGDGDPFLGLAAAYLGRVPCPSKHPPARRFEFVTREAAARRVDGVIFLVQKFCELHAFDYPALRDLVEGAGRPSLLIEVEQGGIPSGQARTRLEAFVERLREGGNLQ